MGDRCKFFRALQRLYKARATNALEFLCEQAPPEHHRTNGTTVNESELSHLVIAVVNRQGTLLALNDEGRALFQVPDFQPGLLDVYELFPESRADRCIELINWVLDKKQMRRIQSDEYSQTMMPICEGLVVFMARPIKSRRFVEQPQPEGVRVIG